MFLVKFSRMAATAAICKTLKKLGRCGGCIKADADGDKDDDETNWAVGGRFWVQKRLRESVAKEALQVSPLETAVTAVTAETDVTAASYVS